MKIPLSPKSNPGNACMLLLLHRLVRLLPLLQIHLALVLVLDRHAPAYGQHEEGEEDDGYYLGCAQAGVPEHPLAAGLVIEERADRGPVLEGLGTAFVFEIVAGEVGGPAAGVPMLLLVRLQALPYEILLLSLPDGPFCQVALLLAANVLVDAADGGELVLLRKPRNFVLPLAAALRHAVDDERVQSRVGQLGLQAAQVAPPVELRGEAVAFEVYPCRRHDCFSGHYLELPRVYKVRAVDFGIKTLCHQ